ncbi:putative NAD(P)-binding protein [Kribbella orskensis]|uniref:NAD(P)-binding protein n=1 Tax=Kribbella orskensis TaxID=2512216 RepID=A0ABY2BE47_9ACTN|nr:MULTISPECIES: SDR family oxidoreductase [Kribbella]TCN36548.1 putative NAD(P)-binding protein [Kribbella sp. VKM Ac-2500]TCO17787.1 putative NAD(P)-binding protein [Kribbella orskensis]
MRVVIAGGHGQIALRLTKILAADGHEVVGLVRNPEHEADIAAAGGEAAVLDLEKADLDPVVAVLSGADVAIFSAGAGPGSGVERKETVDKGAAVLLADAAERAGVRRHLQVSSMGADNFGELDPNDQFTIYLRAKKAAEDDLRSRDLDWTVVRPGGLTNDPGTGKVLLDDKTGYGRISRDDVALVLAGLCSNPASIGRTLELIAGDTPVDEALNNLAS